MSDLQKKQLLDNEGNVTPLDIAFPSKYSVGMEELKTCLNCLESVGRCAFGHKLNLTDTQVHQSLEQIEAIINQLNQQFALNEKQLYELNSLEKRIDKISRPLRLGYVLGSILVFIVGLILGLVNS